MPVIDEFKKAFATTANALVKGKSGVLPPDPAFIEASRPSYDTPLAPGEEQKFRAWKMKHAPLDSGADYDLRGAYKAKVTPDEKTGHFPDTFKKPNHPTFSDQSQYAKFAPHLAGTWGGTNGDQFIPPAPPISLATGLPSTEPPAGSNVVDPYAVKIPPTTDYSGRDFGPSRNSIYPTK